MTNNNRLLFVIPARTELAISWPVRTRGPPNWSEYEASCASLDSYPTGYPALNWPITDTGDENDIASYASLPDEQLAESNQPILPTDRTKLAKIKIHF
jgi:hypothetical protein